jgi:hypothetical protein
MGCEYSVSAAVKQRCLLSHQQGEKKSYRTIYRLELTGRALATIETF